MASTRKPPPHSYPPTRSARPHLVPTHLSKRVDAQVQILGGHHEERVAEADGDRREVLVDGVVLVRQHLPHEHDGHQLERLGQRLQFRFDFLWV